MKRVLIACEFSGVVRDAFTRAGWDAVSCDLLPSETPGNHYQGDVRDLLNNPRGYDLMIAHPPCTYLTNSGVCHLHKDPKRWLDLFEGADFFCDLLNAPIPRKAIENPIPHKYAARLIGRKYSQIIQPYQFGHMERKATCLWLENLPKLQPTDDVEEEMKRLPKSQQQRLHYLSPSEDRWKQRSVTFAGIAQAMADQWS